MTTLDQITVGLAQPLCNELTSSKSTSQHAKMLFILSSFLSLLGDNHDALLPDMLWWLQDCISHFLLRPISIKMCNTPVAQDSRLNSSRLELMKHNLLYNKVQYLAKQIHIRGLSLYFNWEIRFQSITIIIPTVFKSLSC